MLRKRCLVSTLSLLLLSACVGPDGLPSKLSFVLGTSVQPETAVSPPSTSDSVPLAVSRQDVAAMSRDAESFLKANRGPNVVNFPSTPAISTVKIHVSSDAQLLADTPGQAQEVEEGLGNCMPAQDAEFLRAHPEEIAHSLTTLPGALYRVSALPARIDLRSQMPPVRDQGSRGTCVMFSTAGIVDYLAGQASTLTIKQASPQFMDWLYQVEIKRQTSPSSVWTDDGSYPPYMHMLLRREGNSGVLQVPPNQGYLSEQDCPYRPFQGNDPANSDLYLETVKVLGSRLANQVVGRTNFSSQGADFQLIPDDIYLMQAALAAGMPVQVAIPVYGPDWYWPSPSTHYAIPELTPAKYGKLGGHSVVLVGYELDPHAPGGGWFIMRNSWGTWWAEKGHCRLSFQYVSDNGWDFAIAKPYSQPFSAIYAVFPPPHSDPGPAPQPTRAPSPSPKPSVSPSPSPSGAPTAQPSTDPSPSPTPDPSPTPSPSPDYAPFTLEWPFCDFGNPGGYLMSWWTSRPVTHPECGWALYGDPITNWKPTTNLGGTYGDYTLPRLTWGVRYQVQIRAVDSLDGHTAYTHKVNFVAGEFGY